ALPSSCNSLAGQEVDHARSTSVSNQPRAAVQDVSYAVGQGCGRQPPSSCSGVLEQIVRNYGPNGNTVPVCVATIGQRSLRGSRSQVGDAFVFCLSPKR